MNVQSQKAGYLRAQASGPSRRALAAGLGQPFKTPFELHIARALWAAGKDTAQIAAHFGCHESLVYNQFAKFGCKASPKPFKQACDNFAHGAQTFLPDAGLVSLLPAFNSAGGASMPHSPLSQINNLTHRPHSVVHSSRKQMDSEQESHSDGQISHE